MQTKNSAAKRIYGWQNSAANSAIGGGSGSTRVYMSRRVAWQTINNTTYNEITVRITVSDSCVLR